MDRLKDKVAIVTGATGGIGLEAAKLFAAEGARVLLVDLDAGALEAAATAIGPERASAQAADVSDPEQTRAYVEAAVARYGRIDVMFANAGIEGEVAPIADYGLDMFDRVMSVNVRGVWLGLKYAMPAMAKTGGGSIVITSSVAGLRGMQRLSAYVASKHAVVGLMKVAALEGAPLGIRVNTVNPAPIATRMIEALEQGYGAENIERIQGKLRAAVPLKRYGEPAEVARLALFLASDESSYCTGNAFPVDGGMCAA